MPAKPRRRRLWPYACLFLLLALAIGIFYVYRIATLKPGTSIDYAQQRHDRVRASQPNGEDAWPTYEALFDAHQRLIDAIRDEAPYNEHYVHPEYTTLVDNPPSAGPPIGDAAIDAYRAEKAAAQGGDYVLARQWALAALEHFPEYGIDERLDALRAARTLVRPASQTFMLGALWQDLGDSRGLARALRARMRLAGERGDHAAFVADFERTLALARHVGAQATVIERLVGIGITASALSETKEQLRLHPPDARTCRDLLAALDRQVHFQPFSFHIEGEREQLLEYLQAIHSDDGHADGIRITTAARALAGDPPGPRIVNVAGIFLPSKKQMVDAANTAFDGVAKSADLPRRRDRKSVFDYGAFVAVLGPRYSLLAPLGSALDKAIASNDQVQLDLAGTRTLIAIELFRLENGHLPASLAELVPSCLPSLPDDPYAPDGMLRYVILDHPDEHARTFLLYSVGADGTDNHASPARNSYASLLSQSAEGSGTDFIINPPPDPR